MNKTIRGTNKRKRDEERGTRILFGNKEPGRRERHVLFDLAELFEFWYERIIHATFCGSHSLDRGWIAGLRIAEETDFNAITTCLSHKKLAES